MTNLKNSNVIKANFSDSSEENFDYLIIADGVFSETKSVVLNESFKPKYNNSVALRANIRKEHEDKNISIYMGSNFHYVIYPVNQNNEYNFVAILKKKLTEKDLNNHKFFNSENFLNSLGEVIVKNTMIKFENLSDIKALPIFVRNNFLNINQKNIFLSGDAFFAFPPSFAQGASQSIEGANELFNCIINNNSQDYYLKRIKKIKIVNRRSKFNQFIFHVTNPMLISIRNFFLKKLVKNKIFLNYYIGKIYNE